MLREGRNGRRVKYAGYVKTGRKLGFSTKMRIKLKKL